jgi:hypothetical protein
VLARACLARGDVVGAAARVIGALAAARSMTVTFPLALCLETAALVLVAAGGTGVGDLLATAAVIRARGDRPAPGDLGTAVADLVDLVGAGAVLEPVAAAERASGLLAVFG